MIRDFADAIVVFGLCWPVETWHAASLRRNGRMKYKRRRMPRLPRKIVYAMHETQAATTLRWKLVHGCTIDAACHVSTAENCSFDV